MEMIIHLIIYLFLQDFITFIIETCMNLDEDGSSSRSRSRDKGIRGGISKPEPSKSRRPKKDPANRSKRRSLKKEDQSESNLHEGGQDQGGYSYLIEENKEKLIWLNILDAFVVFFEEIGYPKGFSFTDPQRNKLIKQQEKMHKSRKSDIPVIEWKQKATYNAQKEQKKRCQMIKNQKLQFSNSQEESQFNTLLKEVSRIFAEESTMDLYLLLSKLWKISIKANEVNQIKEAIKQYMLNDVRKKYIFFGFRFSSKFKLESPFEESYQNLGYKISENLIALKQFKKPAQGQSLQVGQQ